MTYFQKKEIPEYYPTMYLDGYTPEEILIAHHRSMQKRIAERETAEEITITSEVKVK